MKKSDVNQFSARVRYGVLLLIFCAVCITSSGVFLSKPQAQNKIALENLTAAEPLFAVKQPDKLKQVPQMVNNVKSAGAIFDRRELFAPTVRRVADDAQMRRVLTDGTVFNLNRTAVQRVLKENVKYLTLPLPTADGGSVELELVKVEILAPGFSVKTSAPHNEQIDESFGVHYRGTVKGNDRSLVAVSIYKHEVMGFYSTETGGNVVLGRLGGNNAEDRHVLYADRSLKEKPNFHCDTKDEPGVTLPESILQEPEAILARCVKIYLEANYDLFQNKGSVANTTAYVIGLFNQSATLFANDGVPVQISEIFVWTSPSPYSGGTGTQLGQFKAFRTTFNGNLAHLLSLGSNGQAYVNVLCNTSLSYGVSNIDASFSVVPTYSWTVNVFTHEIGHNLGSPHTHACAWNGNNTAIDGCGPAAGFTEGSCGVATLPTGGTIMSYCHLVEEVGVNFTLGFGTQPRNLILNRLNAAACLTNCGGGVCNYAVSPATSPTFAATGGSGSFNITTGNSSCGWTATVNAARPFDIASPFNGHGLFDIPVDAVLNGETKITQSAPEAVYLNSNPIIINDRSSNTNPPGTASLYPSNISVSGATGPITKVTVSLNGLSHSYTKDIDIILIGPGGQRTILMSDAGSQNLSAVNVTFDSTAAAVLPQLNPIGSGTYSPANYAGSTLEPGGVDIFPLPGPGQTNYDADLSVFNGTTANGTWQLFVVDDEFTDSGMIATGWSLGITTSGATGWININSNSSGAGNNTVSYTVAANPGTSSRTGTITVNNQTHTVNQSGTSAPSVRKQFDFDGDGKADISVFRPSNGAWYLNQTANGFTGTTFGISTDKLVPADFDGDGKTDVAVYRSGTWYLQRSQLGFTGVAFGDSNDIPVPADYDGDGKADLAVFRPSNGTWYLLQSTAGFTGVAFGQNGDKPVAADYDGDGKADFAVNRNGIWYINRSQLGFYGVQFGDSNDKLVPADYDGDGKTDIAVFRPSNGVWYLQQSTAGFTGIAFGLGTDLPTAADYDGDGKVDIAVFRNGTWYLQRSSQGFTGVAFGAATDLPIPNAFVR